MGLPINPLELVKIIKEHKSKNQDQVLAWLELVRKQLRELSQVWLEISKILDGIDRGQPTDLRDQFPHVLNTQRIIAAYVEEFYKYVSIAIGDRVKYRFTNVLVERLADIALVRVHMRERVDELFAQSAEDKERKFITLSEGSKAFDVADIQAAIAAFQRELVALDVFIETVKANPKAFL